jgi:hypothetical protein
MRGGGQGDVISSQNYAGYPITLATTGTVEIRWRTTVATASSLSFRSLSLLKTA